MNSEVTVEGDIIDTMIFFPAPDNTPRYQFVQRALGQNAEGAEKSPVTHLFRNGVALPEQADPLEYTLEQMDRFGIQMALVDVVTDPVASTAVKQHPDRFLPTATIDPNEGIPALRELDRLHSELGLAGISFAPSFCFPQVPIDDRRAYPLYAKCVELNLPVFITVGVPGPRIPMSAQRVDRLDEVCWFFPELTIVMRHGGEPWDELAVKLMQKWPNLYYSTSAFAPRRYPRSIINFANGHGSEKVMFAGYYAAGLTWERVFSEFSQVPFKEETWPKFLHGNARRVLGIT